MIFYVGREWNESMYLWLDLVDIKMMLLLLLMVMECLKFIYINLLFMIGLLLVQLSDDFNCVVYICNVVYVWLQKFCVNRLNKFVLEYLVFYFIRVEIGSQFGVGMDVFIFILLIGKMIFILLMRDVCVKKCFFNCLRLDRFQF